MLLRLHSTLAAAGIPIVGVSGAQGSVIVSYRPEATTLQQTQGAAIVAAFDWSSAAHATWLAQQEKATATAGIDAGSLQSGNATQRLIVALTELVLDEFNRHAKFESDLLAAINAAATLAALKTAVSAITPQPVQRTKVQLVTAIKSKISGTGE